MPEPTSKARRQARRESRLYRVDYPHFKIHYQVDANGYLLFREPVGFLDARRALAAWRAERVRELLSSSQKRTVVPQSNTCAPR